MLYYSNIATGQARCVVVATAAAAAVDAGIVVVGLVFVVHLVWCGV